MNLFKKIDFNYVKIVKHYLTNGFNRCFIINNVLVEGVVGPWINVPIWAKILNFAVFNCIWKAN